jgi:hypothetical protein
MRTLRLSLAGAVIAALLGVVGGAATARSEGDGARVTQFTGTIVEEGWHFEGAQDWEEDGVYHSRGTIAEWAVDWTDPRLPSQMWHRIDFEEYLPSTPESALPYATSVLLRGEDGSWAGTGRGMGYDEGFVQVVLVGDGIYDGLYAILDRKDSTLPDDTVQRTFDGFIVEGELTPMPDPVKPPTD